MPRRKYYVYLLKCRDNSLYCGITNDLSKRVEAHNAGKGSAYVRSRGGGEIAYSLSCSSRSVALKREARIKKLTRSEKIELIKNHTQKLT